MIDVVDAKYGGYAHNWGDNFSHISHWSREKNHFCHSGAVSKQATIKCGFGSFRVFQEFHQKLREREPEREPQRATESHMESLWPYFSV